MKKVLSNACIFFVGMPLLAGASIALAPDISYADEWYVPASPVAVAHEIQPDNSVRATHTAERMEK